MTASLEESPENHFPTRLLGQQEVRMRLELRGVCLLSWDDRSGAGQQRRTLNEVIAGERWHLQLLIINMMVAQYQWSEVVEDKQR